MNKDLRDDKPMITVTLAIRQMSATIAKSYTEQAQIVSIGVRLGVPYVDTSAVVLSGVPSFG